ncbi:hypothetical protein, partial [Vibrio parahaemolyticus]
KLAKKFIKHLSERADFEELFFSKYLNEGFFDIAPKLQKSDLAKQPYKMLQYELGYIRDVESERVNIEKQQVIFSEIRSSGIISAHTLIKFLA